jgi:protein-S-isoprenylcysteine O-methyltransferase Ste14
MDMVEQAGIWLRVGIFLAGSVGLVLASRSSLRQPSSHGFFRLFAFIAILAIILLAASSWFVDPLSSRQMVSWLMLAISLVLAINGFVLLKIAGRPSGHIENTTKLITTGLYGYIRHPLYSSLLFLAAGATLKAPSFLTAALLVLACLMIWLTTRAEEGENLAHFGEDYAYYMTRTKRFIPFIF